MANGLSLSDHKGHVVLVNIWATWCPPCIDEMPSMEALYKEFKGENFEILAVSIDALGADAVAPFMKKYNLSFPALLDPEGTIKTYIRQPESRENFLSTSREFSLKKLSARKTGWLPRWSATSVI